MPNPDEHARTQDLFFDFGELYDESYELANQRNSNDDVRKGVPEATNFTPAAVIGKSAVEPAGGDPFEPIIFLLRNGGVP